VLTPEKRTDEAAIVIRNGDGFRPVIRVQAAAPLLKSKNMDVAVEGLHFVCNKGDGFLFHMDRANLTFRNCSLSSRGRYAAVSMYRSLQGDL
jgi:hypothetical protein